MTLTLSIARDFSQTPGGRYRKDGRFSGEEFRDDILVPALRTAISQGDHVNVLLDGTFGYAASFLDEVFGGLVRERRIDPTLLRGGLRIEANSPSFQLYKRLAEQYISEAIADKPPQRSA